MKLIPLSQNSKALAGKHFAKVDDEDYDELIKYRWSVLRGHKMRGEKYYAKREQRQIFMHRQIMGVYDKNIYVDHKDGDPLNNQRSNLRLATNSQNQANIGPRKDKKYKGTTKTKSGKFTTIISVLGKIKHLGSFDTEEDAAKAYDKAAFEAHGEFAYLNFPELLTN